MVLESFMGFWTIFGTQTSILADPRYGNTHPKTPVAAHHYRENVPLFHGRKLGSSQILIVESGISDPGASQGPISTISAQNDWTCDPPGVGSRGTSALEPHKPNSQAPQAGSAPGIPRMPKIAQFQTDSAIPIEQDRIQPLPSFYDRPGVIGLNSGAIMDILRLTAFSLFFSAYLGFWLIVGVKISFFLLRTFLATLWSVTLYQNSWLLFIA